MDALIGHIFGMILLSLVAAAQTSAPGRVGSLPTPTPPQKRGDRPAPGPAAQGAASAPAAPSAGLPTSSAAVLNTPQHAPDQLDFGSVADGAPVTRTFTLLTNAAGYVSVTIPPGPFRVSEFRELGPLTAGAKNLPPQSQPAAVSGVRSRIRYQEGQSGPYQWSMAPNTQMQVDIVCAAKSHAAQIAGLRLETMNVTGPGPHGNWVITIPLRATVVGLKALSPQGIQGRAVNHPSSGKGRGSLGGVGPATSGGVNPTAALETARRQPK